MDEIKNHGFDKYFVDHTTEIYPAANEEKIIFMTSVCGEYPRTGVIYD